MSTYLLCLNGTCRVLTHTEMSLEVIPTGTQMYSKDNDSWFIFLPKDERGVSVHRLDIGGVFKEYRAAALLLT
jgi:hypothetical protein